MDDKLDFGKYIKALVKKANQRLGLIKKGFDCLDKEMFMNLYTLVSGCEHPGYEKIMVYELHHEGFTRIVYEKKNGNWFTRLRHTRRIYHVTGLRD